MKPTRPLVRYHGGKWKLAPWICSYLPVHRVYVEPFGGGGSVLLRKLRSYAEVYNDLSDEMVNLFRVARDQGEALALACELTPFARSEFEAVQADSDSPLERARQTLVRSFMGFGSNAINQVTGFRANSNRSGTTPARDWMNYPDALRAVVQRLRGVVIEHRDALMCMQAHDCEATLHYCDPPYVMKTRADTADDYQYEMTDTEHEAFVAGVLALRGMVVISGYRHPIYDALLPKGWFRVDRPALADGASPRVESLWISPNAVTQPSLLEGG